MNTILNAFLKDKKSILIEFLTFTKYRDYENVSARLTKTKLRVFLQPKLVIDQIFEK